MKDLIEIHITFDEPIEDDEAERVGGRAVALIVKRLGVWAYIADVRGGEDEEPGP